TIIYDTATIAIYTLSLHDALPISGSQALISVRSRGRYQRPFVVVQDLQRQAETRFLEQEQRLRQRLQETERQLAELQRPAVDGQMAELSAEQEAAVRGFLNEKLRIRKELREVNYRLNADIEALGRQLKLVNILLVPLLLTLGALGVWLWRRRRGACAVGLMVEPASVGRRA